MKRPDIVRAIFRLPPQRGEISIDELSLSAIRKANGKTTLEDEENVSRQKGLIYRDLKESDYQHKSAGGSITFDYSNEKFYKVKWRTPEKNDRFAKKRATDRAYIYNWISELTDSRDYEYLGGLLMKTLGATQVHITPPGNEFGIDFLAVVPTFSRSTLFLSKERGVRIVGQSKLYKSSVAREKVQSFNDVMNSIRNNKAELHTILPPWFRSSKAPLIGFFLAHTGYQIGAKTSAEQNGYTIIDSRAASEIISCSKDLGCITDERQIIEHLWKEIQALKPIRAA